MQFVKERVDGRGLGILGEHVCVGSGVSWGVIQCMPCSSLLSDGCRLILLYSMYVTGEKAGHVFARWKCKGVVPTACPVNACSL
jgi:hypothetical protein